MAKFRKIHTAFWDDPLMEKLSPDCRYFYLFLLTNPLSTECGIYQITLKKMCNYTGYNEDSIKALIKILEVDHSRIVYDTSTEEICLLKRPNWIDRLGKPVLDCIESEFKRIKNKDLIFKQLSHIERDEIRNVYVTYSESYTIRGEEEEEEEEEKKKDIIKGWRKKNYPTHDELGDLPTLTIENAIQFISITKRVNVNETDVKGLWMIFKNKNLTGANYYADESKVHSHFLDSLKYQTFSNGTHKPPPHSNNHQQAGDKSTQRTNAIANIGLAHRSGDNKGQASV